MMNKTEACKGIYKQITEKYLNTFKRFQEAWMKSNFSVGTDMLQYGDDDFYFYRFAVDRQERNTVHLIREILFNVMAVYHCEFEIPAKKHDAPFEFIINKDGNRFGIRFDEFFDDEDIDALIKLYNLNDIYIVHHWNTGIADKWIERENIQYRNSKKKIQAVTLYDFFSKFISEQEYIEFSRAIETFIAESKEIIGYKSVKFLSLMNLSSQKAFEKKVLSTWPYISSSYQIIDRDNEELKNYLYVERLDLSEYHERLQENYLDTGIYNCLIGRQTFAESFITSEWLFKSLEGKKNFDYTSVVAGYLKSIEQLLHEVVYMNIDNSCYISVSKTNIEKIKTENIPLYEYSKKTRTFKKASPNFVPRYPYVEFTSENQKYADSSIGTFEYFLRNNPHIFVDEKLAKPISDMISCFRKECRNGYFHTHNLHDWDIVIKTRNNSILLYYLVLGSINKVQESIELLGIVADDSFDVLCKSVREFRHYSTNFIFVDDNGKEKKMIYDSLNNTMEFSDDGIEHYDSIIFFEVDSFGIETYEKIDSGIDVDAKYVLTRENIPQKIYGVHRDNTLEEIHY